MSNIGTPIPGASVSRRPGGAVAGGATQSATTILSNLTVRSFFGSPLTPTTAKAAMDRIGMHLTQPRLVLIDWPPGVTADLPIAQGDRLTIPALGSYGGGTYTVKAAEPFAGRYITLFVEIDNPT